MSFIFQYDAHTLSSINTDNASFEYPRNLLDSPLMIEKIKERHLKWQFQINHDISSLVLQIKMSLSLFHKEKQINNEMHFNPI